MKVDIQDVLFWMDAIRNSKDQYRALESFWKGQINSKVWLVENLESIANAYVKNIIIHGGWNGVLASLLFNSRLLTIQQITSLDIDPACEEIARTINKRQEIEGRFSAVTADMITYKYDADIVINTSCEHINQEQYDQWLENVPSKSLIVLQSNNYIELNEHVRCAINIDNFVQQSNIKPIFSGTFDTPNYQRFMIIGKKYE